MNRQTQAGRALGESQFFNLHALRRIYNEEGGRGTAGKINRYDMHPTIREITYVLLTMVVPVGKGGYGSPVIELAIRLLLVLVGKMKPADIQFELTHAVIDRHTLIDNLRKLADVLEG